MLNQKSNSRLLYHYTSAETLFLILEKMRLKVSKYQDANDLSEVVKYLNIDPFKSVATSKFIKEQCGYISFSRDSFWYEKGYKYPKNGDSIPTMWAYYANSNRGACIVIDEAKLKATNKRVLNTSWLQNITYKRFVRKDEIEDKGISPEEIIKTYHNKLFFCKQKSWAHEHERRLCIVNPPEFLSIKDCIVQIVLGNRFENSNMLKLVSMLSNQDLECFNQLNRYNFLLQSDSDGVSLPIDDPFIRVETDIERINTFLEPSSI